ncbi:unnamed protein product, partial [Hymenolepis diminuta]
GTLIFAWRFGGPKPDLDREIDSTSSPTGTTFVLVNHETTPNYPKGQMQCGSLYCWMDANAGQWIDYVMIYNGMVEILSPPYYLECDKTKTVCTKSKGNTVYMNGTLPATPFTVAVFGRNGTLIFAWRFGGPKPDLDKEIDSTPSPTGTTYDYGNQETTLDNQKGQMQCGSLYCWMDANAGQWINYVTTFNGMIEVLSPPSYRECDPSKTLCAKGSGNTVFMKGTLPATPFTVAVFGRNGTLIF